MAFSLLTYVCTKCDFHIDPRCALAKPRMIESEAHLHPLAFLNTKLCRYLSCNACGKSCYEKHVFQCADCDFGLHLKCYPLLPQVVKHSCHCDPLTLTYSRIEEVPEADSDEEFYCYACEEARDPDDPTYYCNECPFVAHVDCVISEVQYNLHYSVYYPLDLLVFDRTKASFIIFFWSSSDPALH